MLIGTEVQVVGDRTRYHVDCDWLADNETLSATPTATVDVDPANNLVTGIVMDADQRGYHYLIQCSVVNDRFNVIFQQVTTLTQIKFDRVAFSVVAVV